eukprot:30528-Rhodomonas_salina.1
MQARERARSSFRGDGRQSQGVCCGRSIVWSECVSWAESNAGGWDVAESNVGVRGMCLQASERVWLDRRQAGRAGHRWQRRKLSATVTRKNGTAIAAKRKEEKNAAGPRPDREDFGIRATRRDTGRQQDDSA